MSADISTSELNRLGAVETTVTFNWISLGEHFMLASSEDQALFLCGWDREAEHMGYASEDQQYCWISDAAPDDDKRRSLAARLRRLADFLEEA